MSTSLRTLSVMDRLKQRGARLGRARLARRRGRESLCQPNDSQAVGRLTQTVGAGLCQASDVAVVVWLTQRNSAFGGLEGGGVEIGGAGGDRRHQAGGLRQDLAGEETGRDDFLVEEIGAEAAAATGL